MRILRVISSVKTEGGGPINGLINSSMLLKSMGHDIEVACFDDSQSKDVKEMEFATYAFGPVKRVYAYNKKFSKWIYENSKKYDVVIIHGLWQFHSYAASKACKKSKTPYVIFTHGMLDPWFNKDVFKYIKKQIYWLLAERNALACAHYVLFTSEEEKRLASKSMWPYKANAVVVAYGSKEAPADYSSLSKAFYDKFPELKDKKIGLFLSRIHKKKGIDLLIDAFSSCGLDDYVIAIAGPNKDKLKEKLVKKIDAEGIKEKFYWLDMLEGDVKWGAYIESEFFILPSHQENFGIVVAEALSTATPVLITNKVNIWREVVDSNAGIVDEDSIDGIRCLLNKWKSLEYSELAEMKANARDCYVNNFSLDSAAKSLEWILNKTVVEHNKVN